MNFDWKKITLFAFAGALAAARRDYPNWKSWKDANGAPFDPWRAFFSYVEGALLGAGVALGLDNLPGLPPGLSGGTP